MNENLGEYRSEEERQAAEAFNVEQESEPFSVELKRGDPDSNENITRLIEVQKKLRAGFMEPIRSLAHYSSREMPMQGIEVTLDRGQGIAWIAEHVLPNEFEDDLFQLIDELKKNTPRGKDGPEYNVEKQIVSDFIENVPHPDILKGLSVAEIGGFMMSALRPWGAEVTSTYEMEEFVRENKRVNSENYQDYFGDQQFDITYSSGVFDSGSGIELTTSSDDFLEGTQDLLHVFSKLTRPGGLSIHNEAMWISSRLGQMLPSTEFDSVSYKGGIIALRKRAEEATQMQSP